MQGLATSLKKLVDFLVVRTVAGITKWFWVTIEGWIS